MFWRELEALEAAQWEVFPVARHPQFDSGKRMFVACHPHSLPVFPVSNIDPMRNIHKTILKKRLCETKQNKKLLAISHDYLDAKM